MGVIFSMFIATCWLRPHKCLLTVISWHISTCLSKVATRRIIVGKWGCNNGQACISPDYIITTKDCAEKLVMLISSMHFFFLAFPFNFSAIHKFVLWYRWTLWEKNWRHFMERIHWNQKTYLELLIPTIMLAWQIYWMRIRFLERLFMEVKEMKPTCEYLLAIFLVH